MLSGGVTPASVYDKTGARLLQDVIEDLQGVKKVIADGIYEGVPPFTAQGRIEWQIVEKKSYRRKI